MADLDNLAKSLGLPTLLRRVRLIVGRGTLHRTNDAGAVQTVQAEFLKGEVRDGMERVQNYGFTSHAHDHRQPNRFGDHDLDLRRRLLPLQG